MAFWKKRSRAGPTADVEQAVLLHIPSLVDSAGLNEIEDPIIDAIARFGVGEFDGNAIGPDGAVLYTYGPDADALWQVVDAAIRREALGPGSYAVKRYGRPGASEVRIELN